MKWILLVVLTVCGCYVPDEEPVNETGEALAVPVPLPGSPGTQLEVHSLTPLPTSQLMQVHHESL